MARIEQWDPNIKAQKYQGRGGAYTNPQMPQQADWQQVNKAIQESVAFMGAALGQKAAMDAQWMKVWEDKGAEFEKGIGNLQEGGNAAMEGVVDEIVDIVAADTNKANRIRERRDKRAAAGKDTSRLDRRLGKQEAKEYHQLSRDDKKRAIEKLDQVQALKGNIEKVVTDLAKGDPNNIDWSVFANNPKVKDFFNHILTGEGVDGGNLFSIDVSGNSPKIVWNIKDETVLKNEEDVAAYNRTVDAKIEALDENADNYEEEKKKLEKRKVEEGFIDDISSYTIRDRQTKEITLQELTSGSSLFEDATEDKDAITAVLDKAGEEGIRLRKSQHTGPDAETGGAVWDEETWKRQQKDLIRSTDKSNYEFIFNNMTHTINPGNRMTTYDPSNEQHVADVEQWIDNYLDNKLGEAPPVRKPAPTADDKLSEKGMQRFTGSGGSVVVKDSVVDKAKKYLPIMQQLTENVPEDQIVSEIPQATSEIYTQLENDQTVAQDMADKSSPWYQTDRNYLNKIIDKANKGETLTASEQVMIDDYKSQMGIYTEKVDLLGLFHPGRLQRKPQYDRTTKIVTVHFKADDGPQKYDLTDPRDRRSFMNAIMDEPNVNANDAGFVLQNLFDDSVDVEGNPYVFKSNKPELE